MQITVYIREIIQIISQFIISKYTNLISNLVLFLFHKCIFPGSFLAWMVAYTRRGLSFNLKLFDCYVIKGSQNNKLPQSNILSSVMIVSAPKLAAVEHLVTEKGCQWLKVTPMMIGMSAGAVAKSSSVSACAHSIRLSGDAVARWLCVFSQSNWLRLILPWKDTMAHIKWAFVGVRCDECWFEIRHCEKKTACFPDSFKCIWCTAAVHKWLHDSYLAVEWKWENRITYTFQASYAETSTFTMETMYVWSV